MGGRDMLLTGVNNVDAERKQKLEDFLHISEREGFC